MSDLPSGWEWAKLRDLAILITDGDHNPPKRVPNGVPHLTARHVKDGRLVLDGCTFISPEDFQRSSRRYAPLAGDVIVTCVGTLGETAIVPRGLSFSADRNLAAIRPHPRILSSYLKSILDAPQSQKILRKGSGASAQPHLYLRDLRDLDVPLPPVDEQAKIVAAVDEHFPHLDAGTSSLQKAAVNLRRLRDLMPIRLLKSQGGGTLESYSWMSLADISEKIVDCPHSTPKFQPDGAPCIDTTCISPGVIHRDRIRYVNPSDYTTRVSRLIPREGDLIFSREGTVGTTVIVPPDLQPCLGQRVMLFRPDEAKARSDYLCLVMNSELLKGQYRPLLLGSTVPHLNVRDAKKLTIPVPPLKVQESIMAEAGRISSVLNAAEISIDTGLARSSFLRASILDAAYSGRLTP